MPARKRRPAPKDSWAEIDRLIREQKLEQAATRIEALRAAAEQRGDTAAWTRALVRATEVRIALGGFETAVRQLKDARWPPGVLARTGLDLSFAHALTSYLENSSWEINRRERVETTTNCSACGKETTVPFRPTQGRPVFCRECFQSRKFAGAGGV